VILTISMLLALGAAVAIALGKPRQPISSAWKEIEKQKENMEAAERALGPLAQRFAGTRAVQAAVESERSFEELQKKLRAGQSFAASLEVFFAYQTAALIAGIAILSLSFLDWPSSIFSFVFVGMGLIIGITPYYRVVTKAREREEEVLELLPRFADLLLMVLSSMSVPQALSFTADRDKGPIAAEMRELVRTLSAHTLQDKEAFELTAERIGTQPGRDFIETLASAYIEGTKSTETIRLQVEQLRMLRYQQQRGVAKRIPNRMIVAFALHFLPLLFVVALLPVMYSLATLV